VDAPEGSDLYYCLLWMPTAVRQSFLARWSLINAINSTLHDVHDPGVAEQKVHWWHEEFERLFRGKARHPSTAACSESLKGSREATMRLLDVLSVAASTRFESPDTDAVHRERHERDQQARLSLLAHALSARSLDLAADLFRLPDLCLALGLRDEIAALPVLLHRGYAVFSDARYARHALTPEALARDLRRADADAESAADGVDNRRRMVADVVQEACDAIEGARASSDYRQALADPALTPLLRLHALRAHELGLWRDKRPDLLRERTVATPLRRFFIAWRYRRTSR